MMKTRDEVFKTRPDARTADQAKSKSQLRRLKLQKEGRRDVTMKSPEPKTSDFCLYCGVEYSDYDGRVTRCPKCATPL
jgi:hypothetical protein